MDKLRDEMLEHEQRQMTELMDSIYEELVTEDKRAVINEAPFKEYFLDYFKSIMVDGGERNSHLELKWMELAGGEYREVDVVDNEGKVLFTVPGINNNKIVQLDELKDISFSNMGYTYNMKADKIQAAGINYLADEFMALPKFLDTTADINKIHGRWISIFRRYYKDIPFRGEQQDNKKDTNIKFIPLDD